MKTVLFTILPALGILFSLAFAAWPTWFMDRLERRHRARILCKPIFSVLCLAGICGWYSMFQAGARALLKTEASTIALILTAAVLLLIYSSALRSEMTAQQEKQRRQVERNANRRA